MAPVERYNSTGRINTKELVHKEELGRGDRLVVEVPPEVSSVLLERDGFPYRHIDLDDGEPPAADPDPYGWHGFVSQIDIPFGVDVVRIEDEHGRPDTTFKAINPQIDKDKAEEKPATDGAVELVISRLAGGHIYYRLEFAHPDGEHFTTLDFMEDDSPQTYKRLKVGPAEAAEKPRKATRKRADKTRPPRRPPP